MLTLCSSPCIAFAAARTRFTMALLQDLHLIKAQCSTSTLVTKVKLVERCFSSEATVNFQMYDAAPPPPAPQLPYFTCDDGVVTDENAAAQKLADGGARQLLQGEGLCADALAAVLSASPTVNKAVKCAIKSKTEEVRSPLHSVQS